MTAFGSLALITLCISRQADVDLRAQFQSQEHNLEYLRLSSTLSEQAANDVIALDACNDTSKLHQANYEAAYFQAEIKDERIANIVHWAAKKRFEILKFKCKFSRARTFELLGLVLGCIEAEF